MTPKRLAPVAGLFIGFALLSALFIHSSGTSDVPFFWLVWMRALLADGLIHGFVTSGTDYPPLTSAALHAVGRVGAVFDIQVFGALKILIFAAFLASLATFYAATRHVGALLAFFAGWFLSATPLGYLDVLYAPVFILAIWCLKRDRLVLFGLLFTVACMFKWQPVFFAPFLLIYLLGGGERWRRVAKAALGGLPVVLLLAVVFGPGNMVAAFHKIATQPYLSGNALNVWWIVTHLLHVLAPDRFGPLVNGAAEYIGDLSIAQSPFAKLPFLLAYLGVAWIHLRGPQTFERLMQAMVVGYLCYFMLATSVHENHWLPAVLAATLAWGFGCEMKGQAIALLVMTNINLFLFYGLKGQPLMNRVVLGLDLAVLMAALNVVWFGFLYVKWADFAGKPLASTVSTTG